jgi:glutamate/tyrosine decarboxylase-like PLP-dependent enzyme
MTDDALRRAHELATAWLEQLPERPVRAAGDPAGLRGPLPEQGEDPAAVLDALAAAAEPGLVAGPGPRYFGFVTGGALPAALAADWLASAWDQNGFTRTSSPAAAAIETVAERWVLEALALPADAAVGFATGATTSNFTGLAAARHTVLARVGWDVEADGLIGAPPVRVLVGEQVHASLLAALRYAGLGAARAERIAVDDQGAMRADALVGALAAGDGPAIVCAQAGEVNTGACDPLEAIATAAHEHGAWLHVDGAFGLWAAASPGLRHLVAGVEGADSWGTDAHKTLNTPYDCGIAIVRDPAALRSAFGIQASYLINAADHGDPLDRVPEMSRRARGVPVWAALRSLGRSGVTDLIDGLAANARKIADGIATVPGAEILNDVVYTQVSVAFGDDDQTKAVAERLLADGTAWMSGSRWRDRAVLRVSVSNWSTDDDDVAASVDAVRRAAAGA